MPKPHLCRFCGEENPINFYRGSKSRCKKCANKSATEYNRKSDEKRKAVFKGFDSKKALNRFDRELDEISLNQQLRKEINYGA